MLFASVLLLALVVAFKAYANPCAVCTVGVIAGLEVARTIGVDDGVIGVWSGALLVLIGYWTIVWFDKKNWNFKFRNPLLMILSFSMIAGVYFKELVYTPRPQLLYLDPFLFCALLGGVVLAGAMKFYQWMKAKNGGHAHFPFEKAVLPLVVLALTGFIVNYLQVCAPAENGNNSATEISADGSDIYDFNSAK
jgi:hypothetical protein